MGFFPLYAVTTDMNHRQEKIIRPRGYEHHQIFLVNSGVGILNIGGQSYVIKENDLFYISAEVPHEYYGREGELRTSYLSFVGSGFEDIRRYYKLGDFGVYENRGFFEAVIEKIFQAFDTTHELSALCALTFSTVIAFFDEACKKEYSPIEAVYHYIEGNYAKMITLDDLLAVYPYSKTKLCREFKEKYKVTIFDMITGIRLRHARYMIMDNPHIKLKNVALSCGFNDVSYFCKMYRRFFSCSPKGM